MLTNVKPWVDPSALPPTRVTDADAIRAELVSSGVKVGPDPCCDGAWEAIIDHTAGERSLPMKLHLVAFGDAVKAYRQRGTMTAGMLVWLEDGRLEVDFKYEHG